MPGTKKNLQALLRQKSYSAVVERAGQEEIFPVLQSHLESKSDSRDGNHFFRGFLWYFCLGKTTVNLEKRKPSPVLKGYYSATFR